MMVSKAQGDIMFLLGVSDQRSKDNILLTQEYETENKGK